MKKILLSVMLMIALTCTPAFARYDEGHMVLDDAAGTAMSDYALTSGSAVYSEIIDMERNAGFVALLVTEDKSGGTGDVDISVEYSVDKTNWYTVYTSDMYGTITAEGNVATALGNITRWIAFTSRITRYMRYKFDPDADSQVTVTHIYVVDR